MSRHYRYCSNRRPSCNGNGGSNGNNTTNTNTCNAIEQIPYTSSCPGSCLEMTAGGYRCQNGCASGGCGGALPCGWYCRRLCGCSGSDTDAESTCSCS